MDKTVFIIISTLIITLVIAFLIGLIYFYSLTKRRKGYVKDLILKKSTVVVTLSTWGFLFLIVSIIRISRNI